MTINGKEYTFKRAVVRLVHEATKLEKAAWEAVGTIEYDGKQVPPSMLTILLDEELTAKFQPFWEKYVNLVIEQPEGLENLSDLTTEEVEQIREGFFDTATPMLKRLAALKSSPDSQPSQT